MSAHWNPGDFLLYGRLSDDTMLLATLDRIRVILEARTAILLVARGPKFFRSLIRVADHDSARAIRLQDELIRECNRDHHARAREIPEHLYYNALMSAGDVFPLTSIHTALMRNFAGATFLAVFPEHEGDKRLMLPTDEAPPSLMVVAVDLRIKETDILSRFPAEREQLRYLVNTSQAVRAHRWNYAVREVDRRLNECERRWERELEKLEFPPAGQAANPGNEFAHVLRKAGEELLDLALTLTRSDSGQVFVNRPDARQLLELAHHRYRCGPTIDLDTEPTEGIVLLAYRRARAVLINDMRAFLATHPLLRYKTPDGARKPSLRELTVPITQNLADDQQEVLGVLNLEKEAPPSPVPGAAPAPQAPPIYTTRDLDVCQHLVRRFCRWIAQIQHTLFARSLARLTRNAALASGAPDRGPAAGTGREPARPAGTTYIRAGADGWYDVRVPSEFRRALRPVEEALKTAYELTPSHMARVTLVTADGRFLVPFCDYPADGAAVRHTEPLEPAGFRTVKDRGVEFDEPLDQNRKPLLLPVLNLDYHRRSICAWVARHGRPCFVGDFRRGDALTDYAGLDAFVRTNGRTRSECCVPLFLSGRLIGTLSFQSYYANVHREPRHLINAIAELIGLTFAQERKAVEQGVMASRALILQAHRLANAVEQAEGQLPPAGAAEAPAPGAPAPPIIGEIIRLIRSVLDPDAAADGQETTPAGRGPRPVAALIAAAISRGQKLPAWGHWDPALLIPLEGARVSGDAGFALEVALGEVLYNAQVEAAKSEGQVAVGITTRTLGGRDYVVIGVENPCTSPEVHRFQHELYRLPFRRAHQGRKHLGAFIAGSVLRAAGGELSFVLAPEADGQRFTARTRIEVEIHRGGPGEPF